MYGYWIYSIPAVLLIYLNELKTINFEKQKGIPKIIILTLSLTLASNIFIFNNQYFDQSFVETYKEDLYFKYAPLLKDHLSDIIKVIAFSILYTKFGIWSSKNNSKLLISGFSFFILLNFLILTAQTLIYHLLGVQLDLAIGGVEARQDYFEDFRPTSIFFEPQTAANSLSMAATMLLLLIGASKKLIIINLLLTVASLVMIKSTAGFIYAIVFLIYIKVNYFEKNKIIYLLIITALAALYLIGVLDIYIIRFLNDSAVDGSAAYKATSFILMIYEHSIIRVISGSGIGYNDCFCLQRDVTLGWTLLYEGGLLGLILIISLYRRLCFNFNSKLSLLLLLISQYTIYMPFPWFLIGALHNYKKQVNLGVQYSRKN